MITQKFLFKNITRCQTLNPETSQGGVCDYYPHFLTRKLRFMSHKSISDETSRQTPELPTSSLSLRVSFPPLAFGINNVPALQLHRSAGYLILPKMT